ncbi:hypothetical protein C3L33_19947, partial [Rhododendron williamsianum]
MGAGSSGLKTYSWQEGRKSFDPFNDDGFMFERVPSCLASSLKVVCISDLDKKPLEMDFYRVFHFHDESDIKSLTIDSSEPVNSSRVNSWISASMRHNIQELTLSLSEDGTPQVLGLLSGVVNVKKLSITSDTLQGFYDRDEDGYTLGRVPSCFTSSLKTVGIAYFDEDDAKMWFLRFLLKNATVLERLMLRCYTRDQQKLSRRLNKLPKGSKSCVIELLPLLRS